jgi:hypothetical protein|tara:strand:+ start:312 stop:578 length:267 start_codon:yes stop_codon:yes gene_type:complete
MQRNYRTAYNALKKLGAPVIEGGYDGEDTFRISAENNVDYVWADYYEMTDGNDTGYMMGVSNKINDVLSASGLFAEWINPGVLGVWED